MSTISIAKIPSGEDLVCQGDIYKNVKYSYVECEDENNIEILEYEFPYAVIISQACDVIAMDQMFRSKSGKPTKFMPSILLCPIYDKSTSKAGEHIRDILSELSIGIIDEQTYTKEDYKVAQRDWHYRFHALSVKAGESIILENAIVDFKHYFTLPISYLNHHISDRVLHLDDIFAEQLTLKFSTYLSRVAIP